MLTSIYQSIKIIYDAILFHSIKQPNPVLLMDDYWAYFTFRLKYSVLSVECDRMIAPQSEYVHKLVVDLSWADIPMCPPYDPMKLPNMNIMCIPGSSISLHTDVRSDGGSTFRIHKHHIHRSQLSSHFPWAHHLILFHHCTPQHHPFQMHLLHSSLKAKYGTANFSVILWETWPGMDK